MSRTFKFVACINLGYSKKNILSILENGEKIGCIYKNRRLTDSSSNIINTQAATDLIWTRSLEQYELGPLIYVQHNNSNYSIWFYNEHNKIFLYLSPTHIGWKKRYDLCGSYGINFYRYQRFMLGLIGNNIITHFETYEYFEASCEIENIENNKKIYVKLYTFWPFDVYHHLKVNGKMLHITWLDSTKQPINMKLKDNILETILNNVDTSQCWFAIYNNITLKFSLHEKKVFTVEPMRSESSSSTLDQEHIFDIGIRTTIELFKNTHVFRYITFQNDENIQIINKMDP